MNLPTIVAVKEEIRTNRFTKADYLLLLSLMIFTFVPSINQLIVDTLISGSGSDLLDIAGQIEWFDLLNEMLLAFLIVPMYFVLNKVANDHELFKSRISQTMIIGFVIYTAMSVIIYIYAGTLSSYMNAPDESLKYLRLETIGFILSYVSSYMYVVFVVRGKWNYIVALLIVKVAMLSIGNLTLIPEYQTMGIAATNIIVNSIISITSLILLYKEGLLQFRMKIDKETTRDWTCTGLFSGSTVFLDNAIYMLIVMKMVNEVSSVGTYWLANNFIWGWLLIPIVALAEIVKRDYYKGYPRIYNYLLFVVIIALIWLCSVPLWDVMFTDVIHAEDPQAILNILYLLVPFYVAYALCAVFDGILTSIGKTWYLFGISLIVNIVYYGIVYSMFLMGWFEASISFIIAMFGMGMVVHLVFSLLFYQHSKRSLNKNNDIGIPNQ